MFLKKEWLQKVGTLVVVAMLLTSCAIRVLKDQAYYDDVISDFLVNEDGREIVFFGQKYYYSLEFANRDKLEEVKALLLWRKKSKLHYAVDLMVDGDSKIRGVANLEIYLKDVNDEDAEFLKKYNFFRRSNYLSKQVVFSGSRREFGPNAEYQATSVVFRKYKIRVREKSGVFSTYGRAITESFAKVE